MTTSVAQLETQVEIDIWTLRGQEIVAAVSNSAWDLGDWINAGKHQWGDYYKLASEITGIPVKTLQDYGYVAKRFPARAGNLSWAHHRLVAWIPPEAAQQWLELAAAEHWSIRELQAALRSVKQLPPGRPEIVATIYKLVVPHDHEERWKAAAERHGLTIEDWLILIADEAAA
jgi:hypothetical protein